MFSRNSKYFYLFLQSYELYNPAKFFPSLEDQTNANASPISIENEPQIDLFIMYFPVFSVKGMLSLVTERRKTSAWV